eukprot:5896430-Alexandrium_andersonii.AAC.1
MLRAVTLAGWAGRVSSPPRGQEPNAGGGQQVGADATGCTRMRCASAAPSRSRASAGCTPAAAAHGAPFVHARLHELAGVGFVAAL